MSHSALQQGWTVEKFFMLNGFLFLCRLLSLEPYGIKCLTLLPQIFEDCEHISSFHSLHKAPFLQTKHAQLFQRARQCGAEERTPALESAASVVSPRSSAVACDTRTCRIFLRVNGNSHLAGSCGDGGRCTLGDTYAHSRNFSILAALC